MLAHLVLCRVFWCKESTHRIKDQQLDHCDFFISHKL